MPQLETAKPAGPRSTVPYFTCFKGCFNYLTYFYSLLLKGPSFGAISLIRLELALLCAFPAKGQPTQ